MANETEQERLDRLYKEMETIFAKHGYKYLPPDEFHKKHRCPR